MVVATACNGAVQLLLSALVSLAGYSDARDDHAATVTLPLIRNGIHRIHNMVESLEVAYVQVTDTTSPDNPRLYTRVRFLARNRLRLRETTHSTSRFSEGLDLNHMTQFLTHDSFDYFVHHARYYEKSRRGFSSPTTWKLKDDDYLRVCGWWPAEDEPSTDADLEIAVHLRFVMVNPHYSLLPDAEDVDGHRCRVVESPGVDRVWLDPAFGYAIRKREVYDETGRLTNRSCVKEFQRCEVSGRETGRASIWMPTRISNDFEADNPTVRVDGATGLAHAEIVVERICLNSLDDLSFRFVPPPGTLVYDRDVNSSQQIPGGRNLLDDNIAIEQQRERFVEQAAPRFGLEPALLVVGIAALALCNVYCLLSFRAH